jgi:hypothetical protein
MGSTTQYSLTVLKCYPGTANIDVKNTGGTRISGVNFTLINKSDGQQSGSGTGLLTLAPGDVNSSMSAGAILVSGMPYALRATNFPDIEWTC